MRDKAPLRFTPATFIVMAVPMIVSRAGLAAMGIADGIMVSRHDPNSFAYLSLAEGTLGRFLDVCVAFLIGGLSLVPRHFARGDTIGAKSFWHRTMPVALGLGLIGTTAGWFGSALLHLIRQKPELASGAAPVMKILGLGYAPALLAISAAVYLEGINRPKVVAFAVVTANLLNIFFNWIFISGKLGCPAMGARGSALSTTVVRVALAVALVLYAWLAPAAAHETDDEAHITERLSSRQSQWRLGLSTSVTVAVMVMLASSLTIFAGWLGTIPLAVFAGACSIAAPVALIALGLADATGIFVAAEAGRGAGQDRAAAGVCVSSLTVTLGLVGAITALMALTAQRCAQLYTRNTDIAQAMSSIIPILAVILVIDAVCFVFASSLRALKEAAWPAGIEIASMALLVPIAAELALVRGMGVRGLCLAMLGSGITRAGLLAWRFACRTRESQSPSIAQLKVGV